MQFKDRQFLLLNIKKEQVLFFISMAMFLWPRVHLIGYNGYLEWTTKLYQKCKKESSVV